MCVCVCVPLSVPLSLSHSRSRSPRACAGGVVGQSQPMHAGPRSQCKSCAHGRQKVPFAVITQTEIYCLRITTGKRGPLHLTTPWRVHPRRLVRWGVGILSGARLPLTLSKHAHIHTHTQTHPRKTSLARSLAYDRPRSPRSLITTAICARFAASATSEKSLRSASVEGVALACDCCEGGGGGGGTAPKPAVVDCGHCEAVL